jgi:tetratricopeptide (TPR) repeat protein
MMAVRRELKRPEEESGIDRFNRAKVLVRLGRFGEARAELEACLQLFQNKPDWRAKALSSLADLFYRQGEVAQAITQARRALALREQLPDPADRAISRNNQANYLERHGTPSTLAEAFHQVVEVGEGACERTPQTHMRRDRGRRSVLMVW